MEAADQDVGPAEGNASTRATAARASSETEAGAVGESAASAVDAWGGVPLTADEASYVAAARAPNTLRGYHSDWAEFCAWCTRQQVEPLPAGPATLTGYLVELARAGAAVGTMSRRLSAIRFAHQMRDLPDPSTAARVVAVWEGIRRTHGAPPQQSPPLMPPHLDVVVDACPTTIATTDGAAGFDLAGLRDRALLLVGFTAALRRAELAALTVEQVSPHDKGLVLALPRSKTNPHGEQAELVVLPYADRATACPVRALQIWLETAGISTGPVLRKVTGNRALTRPLHPESINKLVHQATTRARIPGGPYTAHSLRAGFVTYAHLQGNSREAIAKQTRHRSLGSVGTYIRVDEVWQDNAATQLGR